MKNIVSMFAIATIVIFASCRPTAVVVKERPVAPVYVRPVAPAPNYIWVDGGWIRNGRRGYTYRQGYWVAPRPRATYHQGYWKQSRRGYVWVPGRW